MDPNETWRLLHDRSESLQVRATAALHLLWWLSIDGMPPVGITRNRAAGECKLMLGNALDRLDELTTEV